MAVMDRTDLTNIKRPMDFPSTLPSRSIKALVERNQPGAIEGVPRAIAANMTITVVNNPVTGICTAAAITPANSFEDILIATAMMTIETFDWEYITYYPAGSVLDTGRDEILLPVRKGEAAGRHRITGIVSQNAGMLVLEVR